MTETPQPYRVGFFLIPGFALMSYASAIEPLRAANLLSGQELFTWRHISINGEPVTASSGAAIPCDTRLSTTPRLDLILVCAGGNPAAYREPAVFTWLRRADAMGISIGGVSGGPYILARAGLMNDRHMTIHWEHAEALAEEFPHLMLSRALYIVDRNRLTCAGGIAPMDMMHALIAERHRQLNSPPASPTGSSTPRSAPRAAPSAPRSPSATAPTAPNSSPPWSSWNTTSARLKARAAVARHAGLSTRQLDRLFPLRPRHHLRHPLPHHPPQPAPET